MPGLAFPDFAASAWATGLERLLDPRKCGRNPLPRAPDRVASGALILAARVPGKWNFLMD